MNVTDILCAVFTLLPIEKLVISSQVCKTWNSVSKDDIVWKNMVERYRHSLPRKSLRIPPKLSWYNFFKDVFTQRHLVSVHIFHTMWNKTRITVPGPDQWHNICFHTTRCIDPKHIQCRQMAFEQHWKHTPNIGYKCNKCLELSVRKRGRSVLADWTDNGSTIRKRRCTGFDFARPVEGRHNVKKLALMWRVKT
jgi:hypothetical protein